MVPMRAGSYSTLPARLSYWINSWTLSTLELYADDAIGGGIERVGFSPQVHGLVEMTGIQSREFLP
jgi:hypothetical protein